MTPQLSDPRIAHSHVESRWMDGSCRAVPCARICSFPERPTSEMISDDAGRTDITFGSDTRCGGKRWRAKCKGTAPTGSGLIFSRHRQSDSCDATMHATRATS